MKIASILVIVKWVHAIIYTVVAVIQAGPEINVTRTSMNVVLASMYVTLVKRAKTHWEITPVPVEKVTGTTTELVKVRILSIYCFYCY